MVLARTRLAASCRSMVSFVPVGGRLVFKISIASKWVRRSLSCWKQSLIFLEDMVMFFILLN